MSMARSRSNGGEDGGQPLGLGHRARAPVEHEAAGPDVALAQSFGDHVHDQVVPQQLAAVHLVLGLLADGGTLLHRGAQHVAGGDMGHHVMVGEAHALCPLACPLFAEDNEPGSGYHLFEEALVVSHHELAVDLLHRLEGHARCDQKSGAVEGVAGDVPRRHQQRRGDGHPAQEQRPRPGDPVQDVGQVPLGRVPGADTGDVPALFSDDVGLLVGIEGHVDVEEGEQEDEDEVGEDVEQAGRGDVVVDPATEGRGRHDVGQQHRDVEHRAGEDDRDHPGLVDLQGGCRCSTPRTSCGPPPVWRRSPGSAVGPGRRRR